MTERVYLIGPLSGPGDRVQDLKSARDALADRYTVVCPVLDRDNGCNGDAAALWAAVSDDLDALADCAGTVALPGSDELYEVALSVTLGTPIWTVEDALAR